MNIRALGPQKQRPGTPPARRGSTGNRRNSRTSTARWRCSPVRSFVWPTALVKSFLVRIEKSSPLPTQTLSFRPHPITKTHPMGPHRPIDRRPARLASPQTMPKILRRCNHQTRLPVFRNRTQPNQVHPAHLRQPLQRDFPFLAARSPHPEFSPSALSSPKGLHNGNPSSISSAILIVA